MTKNDPRPLVPYMRQSRKKEQTISIEEQRRDIERWASAAGVTLAPEIIEQGISGSKPWRERALGEAVAACERGEAAGIIVAWQDRLSRESNLGTAEVWEALGNAGARLVCAAEGLDTATGDHEMLFTIRSAINRDRWKRYRENSGRSQRSAHERGIPNGQPALGYRKGKDKRLEIDKAGAAKVRKMAELRLAGEPFSRIGRQFGLSDSTVRQILSNDVYLGILRCGALVTENAHPVILTRDQFDALQAARTKRPVPPGDTTRDLLLQGLAHCSGCGHTLKVVTRRRANGSRVTAYYCKNAASDACPKRAYVHADDLDGFVSDWFAAALKETPRMVDVVKAERELEQAQRERDKAEADLRGYNKTADASDPVLFQEGLAARQKRLDDARTKVQLASARTTRLPAGGSLLKLWDTFSPAERRDVLAGFLDRIIVCRGASSNLAANIEIVWSDGQVAQHERRVRVAAA